MRLLVHIGLHKTASTNLQHVLHGHRQALEDRGLYYQANPRFAAQHDIAWALLAGDAAPLEIMLAQARERKCGDVILSSEDLEGVLFDPAAARLIQASAAKAGTALEWHIVLREPGACFASLYAQSQWHVYADALSMFAQVMQKGGLYMHDPAPNWGGTPFWYYSFDHLRDLQAFERAAGGPVIAHDYRDDRPFPGWRLLDDLGILDLITDLPGEMGQNRRHSQEVVLAGYRARIHEAGGERLGELIDAAIGASMAAAPHCARLIGERFAGSHADALMRFARR